MKYKFEDDELTIIDGLNFTKGVLDLVLNSSYADDGLANLGPEGMLPVAVETVDRLKKVKVLDMEEVR